MKITEIDMSKVKDGVNPLINTTWREPTKEERTLVTKIVNKTKKL